MSERTRTGRRGHPRDVDDVLDAERHPVQRSEPATGANVLVTQARCRASAVGLDGDPGLQLVVGGRDPAQACLDEVRRGGLPTPDRRDGGPDAEVGEEVLLDHVGPAEPPAISAPSSRASPSG